MQIGVCVQYNSVHIISLDERFERLEGLLLRKMQKLEVKIYRKNHHLHRCSWKN